MLMIPAVLLLRHGAKTTVFETCSAHVFNRTQSRFSHALDLLPF
jgi:hypothetical protein